MWDCEPSAYLVGQGDLNPCTLLWSPPPAAVFKAAVLSLVLVVAVSGASNPEPYYGLHRLQPCSRQLCCPGAGADVAVCCCLSRVQVAQSLWRVYWRRRIIVYHYCSISRARLLGGGLRMGSGSGASCLAAGWFAYLAPRLCAVPVGVVVVAGWWLGWGYAVLWVLAQLQCGPDSVVVGLVEEVVEGNGGGSG